MDIQAEKLRLIEWLEGVNDPDTIDELQKLKNSMSGDWWDELDPAEKAEIEEGIAQADRGEVTSHEEVMKQSNY